MKKMTLATLSLVGCMAVTSAKADEPAVSVNYGVDVVSSYVWRGQECAGFSVQPSLSVTFEAPKLTLGVWASAELFKTEKMMNMTEFDWSLSWNPADPLTFMLTDYYFAGGNYWGGWRADVEATHNLEATVAYDFGPLALSWNTCLMGPDHRVADDGKLKRNYSTYVEVSAPWKLNDIEGSAAIGASLWNDGFVAKENKSFSVVNVMVGAEKKLGPVPVKGTLVFNPKSQQTFFVVGVSF